MARPPCQESSGSLDAENRTSNAGDRPRRFRLRGCLPFLARWLGGRATSTALLLGCAFGVASLATGSPAESPPSAPADPTAALEALQRLKGLDLDGNPAVKRAVLRVLESTRGTPAFVEIVRDFQLAGQETGLIEVAARHPGASAGAQAIRMLLEGAQTNRLRAELASATTERRAALIEALGNSADQQGIPLLAEAATDPAGSADTHSLAVRGLARFESGARELLRLGREGKLDETARNSASLALAQVRWAAIRDQARGVFPPPRAADGAELPPIPVLAEMRGDAARGARVFGSEQAGCSKCHRVGEEGIDFGPALSQIGTKLARSALFESILDPSAGIAFGYEGWNVTLQDGDEVFGLVSSETAEELAIKQQGGVVVRVKPANIARRERQKLSVMPAGLGQVLTRQELVDLVEYLASLKAPGNTF